MSKITCPDCKSEFNIDDVSYSNILAQVQNQEFDNQVNERIESVKREHDSALIIYKKDAELKLEKTLNDKDKEIESLKLNNREELRKVEDEIINLKTQKEVSEIKLKSEYDLKLMSEAEYYKKQINDREEEIERMKEMKAKL